MKNLQILKILIVTFSSDYSVSSISNLFYKPLTIFYWIIYYQRLLLIQLLFILFGNELKLVAATNLILLRLVKVNKIRLNVFIRDFRRLPEYEYLRLNLKSVFLICIFNLKSCFLYTRKNISFPPPNAGLKYPLSI